MSAYDPKRTSAPHIGDRSAYLSPTANGSALVVIVSAIIKGPRRTVGDRGDAFQCLIWNIENQNILIGGDVIISVHEDSYLASKSEATVRPDYSGFAGRTVILATGRSFAIALD